MVGFASGQLLLHPSEAIRIDKLWESLCMPCLQELIAEHDPRQWICQNLPGHSVLDLGGLIISSPILSQSGTSVASSPVLCTDLFDLVFPVPNSSSQLLLEYHVLKGENFVRVLFKVVLELLAFVRATSTSFLLGLQLLLLLILVPEDDEVFKNGSDVAEVAFLDSGLLHLMLCFARQVVSLPNALPPILVEGIEILPATGVDISVELAQLFLEFLISSHGRWKMILLWGGRMRLHHLLGVSPFAGQSRGIRVVKFLAHFALAARPWHLQKLI